ncbi:hypothetical protein C3K47_05990 [Solitalea longa]|uniref:DUF4142 domain-containing protein n=1 Tax=Solitalea longa TaxID=2079460 RepID=A0A2S5A464_9SPHI|nr:DUF4142 domain-containing protein [Solitalea longa]POY37314.1 hypothetical protein C3K47_05990 [Solitalea longa]
MKVTRLGFVALVACMLVSLNNYVKAQDQKVPVEITAGRDTMPITDDSLMNDAYSYILMGEKSANAALNSSTINISTYARQSVTDYFLLKREFKTLAQQRNILLIDTLNNTLSTSYNELTKLTGYDFDTQYVQSVGTNQTQFYTAFNKLLNSNDPEIRSWAQKMTPVIDKYNTKSKKFTSKWNKTE